MNPEAKKQIVLLVDRAGFHTSKAVQVPAGIELFYLPPYSPELQPAERLWPLLREVIANRVLKTVFRLLKKCLSTGSQKTGTLCSHMSGFNGFVKSKNNMNQVNLVLDELHTIWKGASCRTQKNKAALKLQVRFDVLTGTFQHFQLTDGTTLIRRRKSSFNLYLRAVYAWQTSAIFRLPSLKD